MALYDQYAARPRVQAGVDLKRRTNCAILDLALRHCTDVTPRVLEIGPGDGYIAEHAARRGCDYVAIEGSASVAEPLQDRGIAVHLGYVPPLPAGIDGDFGVCVMLHVIEHMPGPGVAAELIDALRQRLRPTGVLAIACPDYGAWGSRFYDCDYTHSYPMTRRRLRQLLQDQGMEVLQETVYVGARFGRRWLPLSWLARFAYPQVLDQLVGDRVPRDLLNRGVLTFLPNLLTLARPRP